MGALFAIETNRMLANACWAVGVAATVLAGAANRADAAPPSLCEAIRVGEVDSTSAIVRVRLAAANTFDHEAFALAAAEGEVRVRVRPDDEVDDRATPWIDVAREDDGAAQVALRDLSPGTRYAYVVEARNADGAADPVEGFFVTAPAADAASAVRFVVTTGHKYATIDRPGEGQRIYDSMLATRPDFFVHTGDIVYYDQAKPTPATTVALARACWQRMYTLPAHRRFHAAVGAYFIKDDHDLLKDDCWPGQRAGDLTFADGQAIFREQVPMGGSTHRTIRWGRHVQIWLMEGRDHRSSNRMPDGPGKTIWGDLQMNWLAAGLAASDATHKIVFSPTPIVGPDRKNKNDNHANAGFATEGTRVRALLAQHGAVVVCGDRHWQYESVDEVTGLHEYSCGPSTDAHAGGWSPKDVRSQHRFLRVRGGFLSGAVDQGGTLTLRLHDVQGGIVHESRIEPSGGRDR
ncbi:MAG: alkaline phosphatase D family protein [Planctomycetota bacterium]|jgi:alkaline phosphatase D